MLLLPRKKRSWSRAARAIAPSRDILHLSVDGVLSSGTVLDAHEGIVGIDASGVTYSGYDDRLCVVGEIRQMTVVDARELAQIMVRRWKKFGAIDDTKPAERAREIIDVAVEEMLSHNFNFKLITVTGGLEVPDDVRADMAAAVGLVIEGGA
jgi:hypothetical protein